MSDTQIAQFSQQARFAAENYEWRKVGFFAEQILKLDTQSAEGLFLKGLALKGIRDFLAAREHFEQVLNIDESRYDAAIELAVLYGSMRRNTDVYNLLDKYEGDLTNSPRYLDSAATSYIGIGMPERAWPLYQKANELQPDIGLFQANLAACAIYVGELDVAKQTYQNLLVNNPKNRQNHRHYSRTGKATDESHINEMKSLLEDKSVDSDRNMPLYFALGKEYEDLKNWEASFENYAKGCEAVSKKINYTPDQDLALIDAIIDVTTPEWFGNSTASETSKANDKKPIFIAGLPRTGTTLVERIVSSHSNVSSLGETMFWQMALKDNAVIPKNVPLNPENIGAVAASDLNNVSERYLDSIGYRLGAEPYFIEKLPLNFLYLGMIAKAWPEAKIVVLNRNPMDACFSMFKQVFTFVYKFSYSLDHLGQYYVAYNRLLNHWRDLLGDRLIEVNYEDMVAHQEAETRQLLEKLGLPFEAQCLEFEKNAAPSATASSVQVRSKVNSSAVNKWKNFEEQLSPLRDYLEQNGISTE